MLQEYYNTLDLNPGATTDEIKKAYRSKAKLCHPDTNKAPEAHFQFIRIKEAFDILLKVKNLERYRMYHYTRFYHPQDPYFRSVHHFHHHATHARQNHKDKDEENDFMNRKVGRTIYLSVHILFIITGFLIFSGPLYTLLTRGFNPYHTRADTLFAMVAGMTFGIIMMYKISSSFIRFLRKDL
ncbi:MAG: J domain-containing protein [Bacteroidales bacterium]|nr:J domain-containing protein [Bacteroidales bacterium]